MTKNGYVVNGTREMAYEGTRALEALTALVERLGEDAEASEIRIFENMPIEAIVYDDGLFVVYRWTAERWEPRQ